MVAGAAADYRGMKLQAVLDCADKPGHALAALRLGLKDIALDGKAHGKVASIAKQMGARLHAPAGAKCLDLLGHDNPGSACAIWFTKQRSRR